MLSIQTIHVYTTNPTCLLSVHRESVECLSTVECHSMQTWQEHGGILWNQRLKETLLLIFQLTSLELQYVSPKLMVCRDLELAVPGTYDPNQPIIRIQKVQSSLQVITSKQRPRKLSIFGEHNIDVQICFMGKRSLK